MGDEAVGWEAQPLGGEAPGTSDADAAWSDPQEGIADELAGLAAARRQFWQDPANAAAPTAADAAAAGQIGRYADAATDAAHTDPTFDPSDRLPVSAVGWDAHAQYVDAPTGAADAGWSDPQAQIAAELAELPGQREDFWADAGNRPDPATQQHADGEERSRRYRAAALEFEAGQDAAGGGDGGS